MQPPNLLWAPLEAIELNPDNARALPFDKVAFERALEHLEWSPDYLKPPRDPLAQNQEDSLLSLFLKQLRHSTSYSAAFCDAFDSLAALAAAIRSPERLIQPITATQHGTGWVVSSGNRRFLAHILMGATHVKLIAIDAEAANHHRERALLELQENLSREDLTLIDELMGVKRVLALHALAPTDLSINALQRMIGWTNRTRAQRMKDVLARDKLVALIEAGVWSDLLPAWQARHETDSQLDERLAIHQQGNADTPTDANESARQKTQDAARRILKLGGATKHQAANKLSLKSMVIGHHAQGLLTEEERDRHLATIDRASKEALSDLLVELNHRAIERTQPA